jgi:predicted acyltransferase
MQPNNSISNTSLKRYYALDALRGLVILAMILSGTISYKILPDWMYHAQEPPPNHIFNPNLPGLTWVDIVFPIFLFSLGAAIPLALLNRLAKGLTKIQIIFYIFKRGLLLGIFAIFLQHIRPLTINQAPTTGTWWIALLGFLILFLLFVRWSKNEKIRQYAILITPIAWIAAGILVCLINYPDGHGFSVFRSDIILIVLTNMAVFGSLAWFFTKNNWLLRLGLLGFLIALRLSATVKGSWIAVLWQASPIPWIFQFDYLKYLFIVIPGTIAGDLIIDSLQTPLPEQQEAENQPKWQQPRFYGITFLMLAICITLIIGLQARWLWQTNLVCVVICVIGWFLFLNLTGKEERLIKYFYQWGVYWLILGLLLEPFENGIKKDPSTLSYYFVTTAIAFFLLIIFTIIIDIFKQRQCLHLLIANGQNPMIGYVAFANLLWPILKLTNFETLILPHTHTPLTGFLKGVVYTLIIAIFVSLCTKLKLFWRT